MKKDRTQPAAVNYFFKQSYVDLADIIRTAWRNNINTINRYRDSLTVFHGALIALGVAIVFAILSMYVFGTIICAVLTVIHITALLAVNLAVYMAALVLRLIELIYISVHRIFGACPYCKNRYSLPVYLCDCGAEHDHLVPGKYGVIKRRCICGKTLPTSILTGRAGLKARCPICARMLDNSLGVQESVPICVPVIGGPSVGKTCYITAVMKELTENVAPQTDMEVLFYDRSNQVNCQSMISMYQSGVLQHKTSDRNPAACNFFIRDKKGGIRRLLYFYDIAGEAFTTVNALASQKQYEYSHGFLFIIDPLSIPRIREKYASDPEYERHAVSQADINETFDSFMGNLSRVSGMSASQLSRVPCAVIINKIDAFELKNIMGAEAVKRQKETGQYQNRSFDQVMDMVIRSFLNQNGMANFVKNVDMCFKNVQYFAVSALGHVPNGQKFQGEMILAPFAWILSAVDGSMKSMFKRYGKIS